MQLLSSLGTISSNRALTDLARSLSRYVLRVSAAWTAGGILPPDQQPVKPIPRELGRSTFKAWLVRYGKCSKNQAHTMATKKPETEVEQAFARASRRMPMTMKKLPAATRTRRQVARTVWTANQLLEAYRDPRQVLLEIASTDTAELAAKIGCTFLEALQERRLCAQAVLPYVAQKLPVHVDMRHSRAIHLNIVSDERYQELVNVAEEPGHYAQSVGLQLVNGLGAESTTDETAEGETGVLAAVPSRAPGG